MGKLTPSSLFYLPFQAQIPANSFLIDHNAGDVSRSIRMSGLDAPPIITDYPQNRGDGGTEGRSARAATDGADEVPEAPQIKHIRRSVRGSSCRLAA